MSPEGPVSAASRLKGVSRGGRGDEEKELADRVEFEICGVRFRFRAGGAKGQNRAERKAEKLASGDRVVFRRDDRQGSAVADLDASPVHGVRRGSLGTVVGAERRRVEVQLDDGRRVAFDPVRYRSVLPQRI